MISPPVRERIRISTGSHRGDIKKVEEKNVKQVLAEATETRRKSAELSSRLKHFLAPMTLENVYGKAAEKKKTVIHPLKEDDVLEIINDKKDDNKNVMDVRVPRLEAILKTTVVDKNSSEANIIETMNKQKEAGREYKILKQLLKDTEDINRRNKELTIMMERALLAFGEKREELVKKTKVKRSSDASKNDEKIKKESKKSNIIKKETKRSSINSNKQEPLSIIKSRPKTEVSVSKIKRISKTKTSSSTNDSKLLPVKPKRVSIAKTVDNSRHSLKPSGKRTPPNDPKPELLEPSEQSTIKDITDMIDAIGRRETNNDEMQTLLTRLNQTTTA